MVATSGSPKKRAARRKNKTTNLNLSPEAKELTSWTCRKCLRVRRLSFFYPTTNPEWDSNGHMTTCRYCVEEMFEKYYVSEGSLAGAILKLCKILNVRFDFNAIESTQKQIDTYESRGKQAKSIFGIYKKNLVKGGYGGFSNDDDLTYHEGVKYDAPPLSSEEYDQESVDEIVSFWGQGMTPDEYNFLESELDRYKKTHKCDTAAEESLLRQICFCELDIRKSRENGGTPSKNSIDLLQSLMKTASVDPAKAAIASAGKSQDAFSAFIKTIEANEPADYYKDKELFKDFDNISWYFEKYVTRPIKNFITLSRDFNVEEKDLDDDDFDIREASEN